MPTRPSAWSIALLVLYLAGCSGADPVRSDAPEVSALKEVADFPIGAALSPHRLRTHTAYRATVIRHFDSITAENVMKMHRLQPERGTFAWEEADYLVAFAREHGMRVHGHTLLWHSAVPPWVRAFEGTPEEWDALVEQHVRTVVSRYRGRVTSWDVVNEAFNDDGTWRDTLWRQRLGPDYVAKLFRWARAADPDAKLFYNDYNLAASPAKLAAVLTMLDDFDRRGVPIDGVGMQLHVELDQPSPDRIREAATAFAERGLHVHFSELDARSNGLEGAARTRYSAYTPELGEAQRIRYRSIASIHAELPETARYGITTWGVSDADTWIRSYFDLMDWPLLFDEQYRPKAAFHGFAEGLRQPGSDESQVR